MLNHFHTPLGLSLASLLSRLFLPPDALETLRAQGYAGRQVVLAQNSRDFVFIRRYRYMFVLRSQKLGGAKMHARQERAGLEDAGMHKGTNEDEQDDTIKTRFQEIGPRLTIKMRWLRRGQLGETREERAKREAATASGADDDGTAYQEMDLDTGNDAREEREAAAEIGLDGDPNSGELNERLEQAAREQGVVPEAAEEDAPAPTERRRKRKLKSHPLLRPAHSPSPPPGIQEGEAVPKPQVNQRGKVKSGSEGTSLLSSVGKSWHPGKGEGGVRDAAKSREWEWQVRRLVFLARSSALTPALLHSLAWVSRDASSSCNLHNASSVNVDVEKCIGIVRRSRPWRNLLAQTLALSPSCPCDARATRSLSRPYAETKKVCTHNAILPAPQNEPTTPTPKIAM